jgi:hypothetical protein
MSRGRPRKRARNITGLHNQTQALGCSVSQAQSPEADDEPLELAMVFDSLKLDIANEDSGIEESDVEELTEWEDLDDETLAESLVQMTLREDPKDRDWVPERLMKKAQKRKAERKGICHPTQ